MDERLHAKLVKPLAPGSIPTAMATTNGDSPPACADPVEAVTDPETLQRAMDSASNGVVIASAAGNDYEIVYMNAGFERITGYQCEEVLGRDCRFLQGADTDPEAVAELSRAVRNGTECRLTLLNYRKDGEPFWNELFLSPIRDGEGRVIQYVGIQNDVSERQQAQEQVQHLAYHDALTGLGNRAKLERDLASALEAAAAAEEAVALLYLDLDDFKGVNDSLGHVAGDELLRQAAERTQRACRPGDLLTRQGGDEFLILLTGLAEEAEKTASAVAARVTQAMHEPFHLGGHLVTVGASVGISLFPRDAADPETLLTHADTAMYVAKGAGRGRVSLYAGDHQTAPHRRGLRTHATPASVQEVIEAGAVRPVYQPIVELHNGAIAGYEALSRGPVGSPLERPDLLFAQAREHGLTARLDWLCRAEALRAAMEAGLSSPLSLFVNAEPDTLATPPPESAREVWERTRSHSGLFLEITERALTDRPAELLRAVQNVRAHGWGIALDDVGADVRSLALMPLLSPDVVKLDLRLIQEQPNVEVAEIVSAVSAYRERTGAVVLAEGIETDEHLAVAFGLGASLGQGWLFGRPVDLPAQLPWNRIGIPTLDAARESIGTSPYDVVRASVPTEVMTKPLLISISKHLENQALSIGSGAVVVAAFQSADRFTPATRTRYRKLADQAAFVAALGVGMETEPVAGVRGAQIPPTDVLAGEWSIAVVGPHFAGALVAKDLGDTGSEDQRRFDYAITYDRELVVEAVKSLMQRVEPAPVG